MGIMELKDILEKNNSYEIIREEKINGYTHIIAKIDRKLYAVLQYQDQPFFVQTKSINSKLKNKISKMEKSQFIDNHSLFYSNSNFDGW